MKNIKTLYKKMSEHTAQHCASKCRVPHSCCSPEYCEITISNAKEHGVVLTKTNHVTLPLMGENGCIAEPHLRPICTLHVCCINGLGFDPTNKWTKEYFKIREKIEKIENGIY